MLDKLKNNSYYMQKKHILEKAIVKAGYEAGICFADLNKDGICLDDGRPNPVWLNDNFCDMVSEALYGDSQADDIEIDDKYFGEEEFKVHILLVITGMYWNVMSIMLRTCFMMDGINI